MLSNQKPVTRNQNKNVAKLLKKRLPGNIFKIIRKIGNLAQDYGFSAYIVGGFVRDILLGVKNLDLDIVVEGDALAFVELLQDKMDLAVVRHQRFGTATITLPNRFKIDIASSRKEHYAHPAVLPEVNFSSLKNDLLRRDFTINALAITINRSSFGELQDLFGGQQDLRAGKIRVLHERSFIDDPTRILRAVRFEQRYNFTIERHTRRLIHQAKRLGMLNKLSKFRIGDEIILLLKEDAPLRCLLRLSRIYGLNFIHPLLRLDRSLVEQFRAARTNISSFKRRPAAQALNGWLVYFMILTSRLNLKKTKKLCRDFSLTKRVVRKLETFKKNAAWAIGAIEKNRRLPAHQIYQILQPFSCEELLALLCKTRSKRAKRRIRLFLNKLSRVTIKLTGRDLKRMKLKPGPRFKDILQKVLYAKVDGKLKSKVDELNYVRRLLKK